MSAISGVQPHWLEQIAASRERTLTWARTGEADHAALRSVADFEAFSALHLVPMPIDPVAHLRVGYAKTRTYLERLALHDPAHIVSISASDGYVYPMTPRKILRRVLDHALDHFNQIDQWIDWREQGIVPIPTDGWTPAGVTLAEDLISVTDTELSAWLWRIDRVMDLLIHRAAQLTADELNWQPPDGGWDLRRVLHDVAYGYGYAAWLDEALPEEVMARYGEANQRLCIALNRLRDLPPEPGFGFYLGVGRPFTVADAVHEVFAVEAHLQTVGEFVPTVSELATPVGWTES